jgi:two-component system OmpR family response regulator
MNPRPSILIVDDHQSITDPLSTYMRRFDFEVEAVADGKAMRERLAQRSFSLIVLDLMLPGEGGLSLCRYVTEHLGIPVILLTAVSEQADRVAGLEVGADDYVTKPFDPRELVARVRSVLRRSTRAVRVAAQSGAASTPERVQRFAFNGWVFDIQSRELRNADNEPIVLSTAEFHLLRVFVENPNRVLTRGRLLDLTQRDEATVFDRSIDSQVSRLRKKLELDPRRPRLLKTARGDGYLFAAKVTVLAS